MLDDRDGPAARRTAPSIGVRTDRPDGDLHGLRRHRLRRRQLASAPRRPGCTAGRRRPTTPSASRRRSPCRRTSSTSASASRGREGVDIEILGCTGGVTGGGFLYTNLDTLVGRRRASSCRACRPAPPARGASSPTSRRTRPSRRWSRAARLKEYSAHLIPEGGWHMMPAARRRRDAGRRRRRGAVPGRRHLARGRQLRDGVRACVAGQAVDGHRCAATRSAAPGSRPATATRLEAAASCSATTASSRRAAPRAVRSGAAPLPGAGRDVVERHVPRRQPRIPKPGLRRILAARRNAAGLRWRDLLATRGRWRAGARMTRRLDRAGPSGRFEDAHGARRASRRTSAPTSPSTAAPCRGCTHEGLRRRVPRQPVRAHQRTAASSSTTSSASSAARATSCATWAAPSPGPYPEAATASSSAVAEPWAPSECV